MLAAVVLSLIGTLLVHRFIPQHKLKSHNDITGPIFSTLGVIYAVLLGFVVVAIWQKFDRVRVNTEMEVNCLVNLYMDAEPFEKSFGQQVRSKIATYTREIIKEWDMLAMGKVSPEAHKAAEKLFLLYSSYSPQTETEKIFFDKSVDKINELLDLRVLRLIESHTGLHQLLWFALIIGGLITILFTIFFGSESLRVKLLMSTLLAISIALVLFTTLEFSYPFTGTGRVSSESFRQLILHFNL
jgi:hypothetical protein